jgi:hypothetical protein
MGKAQTLKFEQFTTRDGLLSDEVYNLHQDKKGYIWLFTNYGPMKYNGKVFSPTLKNLPFSESVIYAIYENKAGRKWIANSNKNIYEIINDSAFVVEGTQPQSEKLRKSGNEIYQICVDDSLNIYIRTRLNTYRFSKREHYKARDLNVLFENDSCAEVAIKLDDVFLSILKINQRTYKTEKITVRLFLDHHLKKSSLVSFSGVDRSKYYKQFGENIYFNFFNKMIKVKPDMSLKEIIINEQVLSFTKDRNDHLWLATYRGLIELDENDSIISHYFPDKTIHDVLADKNNGLWISTDGKGIYHCKNINELYYDETTALGKPVNFIKQTGKTIFVGTTDFNLNFLNKKGTTKIDKIDRKLFDDPLDILYYKGFYLISYMLHYEIVNAHTYLPVYSSLNKIVYSPFKIIDNLNDTLLFLGRNSVRMLDGASILKPAAPRALKPIPIAARAIDGVKYNKTILIGTNSGVYCFVKDSLFYPTYLQELETCIITEIAVDHKNNCWFCTKGSGLFKLNDKNELTHYTTTNGLPSNIVNHICFVKDHEVLLSTNKGLFFYKNYSNTSMRDHRQLLEGEVQSSLLFEDKIYVGTKNGLILIKANILTISASVFFNLRSVYVNDAEVNVDKLKSLNYKDNSVDFIFDVLAYSGKEYSLKYILQNATVDTGIVTDNRISFRNLSPGNYTLTVITMFDDPQKAIQIPFNIVPAFWQTGWFYSLCVLCSILIIVFGAWSVFKYYRRKELKKNEAERIIAEYRLIALKAQINPHFMSNCIAAIQHLILNNKVDEANEYLAKFSFLVRQVLNLSNKSLVPLREEIEIIDLYIKLEQLRFDKIKIEFRVDPAIDLMGTYVPPILLQPIIENAIWHGLLPLGHKKIPVLLLIIKKEEGMLKMIVEDNGVGRKVHNGTIGNSRESKGIAITMQRIENLKYLNGRDVATLSYKDLVNEQGEPGGTRVVISLPGNLHL